MKIEQFVMAYKVEQDRLRAMLPHGFESLRPVLRINVEIRGRENKENVYVEFNTPVTGFGKRGWLNISCWETPKDVITYTRNGKVVKFQTSFLEITYTGVGVQGGCPAEKDNEGCFFITEDTGTADFVPTEEITEKREFCDCEFRWSFTSGDAGGVSIGDKSVAAVPTQKKTIYEKQELSAPNAARIECEQVLGAYTVVFER